MKHILSALFIFLSISGIYAQFASAKVDSATMLLGDQRKLQIKVIIPHNANLKAIQYNVVDSSKVFEIIEKSPMEEKMLNDSVVYTQDVIFSAYDSGQFYFPALPIVFEDNNDLQTIFTQQIPIYVKTPLIDSTGLAPIKPIMQEPLKLEDWIPTILTVLVLGLLAFAAYRVFKNKQNAPAPPVIKAIETPFHELALKKLAALEKENLWQKGQIKPYYSELTFILREYIEKRYKISALEATTEEIGRDLNKKTQLPSNLQNQLLNLLRTADLVKFAKATPNDETHLNAMEWVIGFVKNTAPIKW